MSLPFNMEKNFINGHGKRILVVDDESKPREILADILQFQGFEVELASNGADAIDRISSEEIDCVLCDVKMPGSDGLEVLRYTLSKTPNTPVIMVSGYSTIQIAVEATKSGAFDFLEKPLEAEKVLVTLRNALVQRQLQQDRIKASENSFSRYGMIGESPVMKTLFSQIERIAPTECRVIIRGETGTGKELVARAIHKLSRRSEKPLIAVNCAAIAKDLIESQLFGHKKGSFTGAMESHTGKFVDANGGTLFLDEITDLSMTAQSKVLRAVELGEIEPVGGDVVNVNVRLLVASQKSLKQAVEEKQFREDLYHRLNVVELILPPLRDRQEDINLLAQYFFKLYKKKHQRTSLSYITPQALLILSNQPFPGNVRELQHVMERLVLFAQGPEVKSADVYAALETSNSNRFSPQFAQSDLTFHEAKEAFEKAFLRNVLEQHNNSISSTADVLKMDRTNLWRKIKKYGLEGK